MTTRSLGRQSCMTDTILMLQEHFVFDTNKVNNDEVIRSSNTASLVVNKRVRLYCEMLPVDLYCS
jgi:hypothetical protein